MFAKIFFVACCIVLVCGNVVVDQQTTSGFPQSTQQFPQHAVLDVNELVRLYWEYNDTHITFEVHAQTTGWVGIGISPSGSMVNADIHVGWVKNGVTTLTDRHGLSSGNTFPPKDSEENLELLEGRECDGWTIIKFRRQLAACQTDEDKEITSDTVRLIYATGGNDPTGSDITVNEYHGNQRGSKSILLLDQTGSAASQPAGETYQSFELLNNNFSVPSANTYYACTLFKLPTFPSKQHLVKVEPIVQAGNELNVHHILVYQCTDNVTNSQSVGTSAKCYSANMPPDFKSCSFVIQAWAIGGGTFYYPPHVGLPLGEADSPKYVVLEFHYDNPEMKSDIVDSSGLRFTYTSNLRQYDAGVMEVGHTVSGYSDIIPPNAESFLDSGECTDNCLGSALAENNQTEINAFAVMLHSHLLGRQLTLKHVRNATELPHIAEDRSYDFNFQETRFLRQERVIKSGDSLQMICNYNSLDRTNVTVGGLETAKEMCLSYLYYYPKISLTFCETAPNTRYLLFHLGIQNVNFTKPPSAYSSMYDVLITKPVKYAGMTVAALLNSMDWNETTADAFAEVTRNMLKFQKCSGTNGSPSGYSIQYPALQINQTYTTPVPTCTSPSQGFNSSTNVTVCSTTTTPMVTTTSKVSISPSQGFNTSTDVTERPKTTPPVVTTTSKVSISPVVTTSSGSSNSFSTAVSFMSLIVLAVCLFS